jgi:FlaA1/EpsC-like NDP-sugar epimerase
LSVRSADNPQGDIEISLTGARPGEKLYEELLYDPSRALTTRHPKIMRAKMGERRNGEVESALDRLKQALDANDETAMRELLFGFIADAPEPTGPSTPLESVAQGA